MLLRNNVTNDNDANFDSIGDGVNIVDGPDADFFSIGGNLQIIGSTAYDTDVVGTAVSQHNGFLARAVAGTAVVRGTSGQPIKASGNRLRGLDVHAQRAVTVFGGEFDMNGNHSMGFGSGIGIVAVSHTQTVTLRDINARDNVSGGILGSARASAVVVERVAASDNNGGAYLIGATDIKVSYSDFSQNAAGLLLQGALDVELIDVTASDNWAGHGIEAFFVDPPRNIVHRNVIAVDNGEAGVEFKDVTSFTDHSGTYSRNDDGGIRLIDLQGSALLVNTTATENDADNDGLGDGLLLGDSEDDTDLLGARGNVVVRRSTFGDPTPRGPETQQRGINLFNRIGGDLELRQVRAFGNATEGVLADGANSVTVLNSRFEDNGRNGLEVRQIAGDAEFTRIHAENNGEAGIAVEGVTGNTAILKADSQRNARSGIRLLQLGNVEVYRTSANNSGGDGLLMQAVGDALIRNSEFQGNRDGLNFEQASDISIRRTSASANRRNGLLARVAGDLMADRSEFSHNGRDGIHIQLVGANTFTQVQATGNLDNGLECLGSGLTLIVGGLFAGNIGTDIIVC